MTKGHYVCDFLLKVLGEKMGVRVEEERRGEKNDKANVVKQHSEYIGKEYARSFWISVTTSLEV